MHSLILAPHCPYTTLFRSLQLAFSNPSATPVWAPTGIALATLLLAGYDVWPAIVVGAFFVNLTTAGSGGTSLGIAVGNTVRAEGRTYELQSHGEPVWPRPL